MKNKNTYSVNISNGIQNIPISDGLYFISINESDHKYHIVSINLAEQLIAIIKKMSTAVKHFSSIFHLIFNGKEEDFLNHPDHIIIDYLEINDGINNKLNKEELFKFNVKKLLIAYNKWQGTSLKFKDVESFCR